MICIVLYVGLNFVIQTERLKSVNAEYKSDLDVVQRVDDRC